MTASGLDEDHVLVTELCAVDEGLTDWEVGFAESLGRRVFDTGRGLTGKQRARAQAIMDRIDER